MQPVKHVTWHNHLEFQTSPCSGHRNKKQDLNGYVRYYVYRHWITVQIFSELLPFWSSINQGLTFGNKHWLGYLELTRPLTSTCFCNCRFFPVSSWHNSCDSKSLDPTGSTNWPSVRSGNLLLQYGAIWKPPFGKNIDNFPGTIEDVHVQTYSTLPTLIMWSMMRLLRSQCKKDHHRGLTARSKVHDFHSIILPSTGQPNPGYSPIRIHGLSFPEETDTGFLS
jgi:hypothetical protein